MKKEIKIMKYQEMEPLNSANNYFKERKECQPKPPKIKMLKAWIETFDKIGNNRELPIVWFDKPTKLELETAKEYHSHYYPCVITYQLNKEL